MASPLTTASNAANKTKKTPINTTICSSFLKEVYLHDWWLIKSEFDSKDRRLGVGGFASRESQVIRAFCSAAIVKRHDTVTLETADGITITVSGFINRSLTLENGFPSEVCNHFLFGFPYYWEEYASRCVIEQSVNRTIPSRDDCPDRSPQISMDDLQVTRVRDLLLSSLGDTGNYAVEKNILNDIMRKYGGSASKHDGATVKSNVQSRCPGMTTESTLDGTPSNLNKTMGQKRKYDSGIQPLMISDSVSDGTHTNHEKTKNEQKTKDGGILNATDTGLEGFPIIIPQSKMGVDVNSSSRGVTTRSMTKLNNVRNKQVKSLSPNTSANRGSASSVNHVTILSDADVEAKETPDISPVRKFREQNRLLSPSSTSEASKNRCGGLLSGRNGSDVCYTNIVSGVEMYKQIPDNSAVRRSNRLRNISK